MLYKVVAPSVGSELGTILLIELSWSEEGFVCMCPWPKDGEPYEALFKRKNRTEFTWEELRKGATILEY